MTLRGYRHGSPPSPSPRSVHARFSSREHRVLPRYLRPSPSSFILSGRVGGSGENLGAISICRLLCLVLSFSPFSSPLPLSLSFSFSFAYFSSIYLCLVHARVLLVLVSLVSHRLALSLSLSIVASSLSPIRYRKLASGTLSRGSTSKR